MAIDNARKGRWWRGVDESQGGGKPTVGTRVVWMGARAGASPARTLSGPGLLRKPTVGTRVVWMGARAGASLLRKPTVGTRVVWMGAGTLVGVQGGLASVLYNRTRKNQEKYEEETWPPGWGAVR